MNAARKMRILGTAFGLKVYYAGHGFLKPGIYVWWRGKNRRILKINVTKGNV